MTLTVGTRADASHDRAVLVDLDCAVFDVESGGGRDLHVGAQPDPQLLRVAGGSPLGLERQHARIIGSLDGRVERLLVLAVVVVGAAVSGERELIWLDEVLAPDLGRIDAEFVGCDVHETLEHLRGLWPAGAAIGSGLGGVRDRRQRVEPDLRNVVDALDHGLGEDGQEGADGRIGAAVCHRLAVHADEHAVVGEPHLGVHHHVPAVSQRDHVLAADLGPLHRLTELLGDTDRQEVLDVGAGLGAETTADGGRRDPDFLGVEAALSNDHVTNGDRVLARDPDGHGVVFAGNRQASIGLHGHAGQPLAVDAALDDSCCAFERVAIFQTDPGLEDHVAAVLFEDDRRALGQCLLGVGHDVEWFVVGHDGFCCVLGLGPGAGDDSGDDVADEADLALGQRRSSDVRREHREPEVRRHLQVVGRVDAEHPWHVDRIADVDGSEVCMGVR